MRRSFQFTFISIGILLMLIGGNMSGAYATILVGPYSQHADTNSIIITWETTEPTKENEVHWGLQPTLGNITKEKDIFPDTMHAVKLTGLQANQKYYYTTVSDGMESPQYSFWTAFEQTETIRFIVYGDSRGGWDNWKSTLIVSQGIEKENPAVVFNTGDLVDDGKNKEDWIDFFTASPFIHNNTLFPVLGNHEHNSRLYFSYFSLPFPERWYSYENGPVHFIALDSNIRFRYRITQYLWMLHELRTNRQPFTIILFHHPPYSSGTEHGNSSWLQRCWAPVFERYHVDVVVNGHDHDYERSIVNGVTYIVTGGGGAPLYDVGKSPWTIYSEKTFHYCVFTVDTLTLTFEAKKPTGDVFDSFILTK